MTLNLQQKLWLNKWDITVHVVGAYYATEELIVQIGMDFSILDVTDVSSTFKLNLECHFNFLIIYESTFTHVQSDKSKLAD